MQTKSKLKYFNLKKETKIIRVSEEIYYEDKFNNLKGIIKGTWK